MKRYLITLFTLLCIAALPASAFAKDKWELSLTTPYMEKHPTIANVMLPWIETIKQATNGRVIIQYFNPGTICPETEIFSAAESGVVNLGAISQSMTPGRFPRNETFDLPLLTSNSEAGSLLSWDAYQHFPSMQKEEAGVKVLWHWASAPMQLHTIKKPVRTMADVKGMKLIGWTPQALEIIRALGASPVQVTPNDSYLSLQRGMADGILCPLAPVRSIKIDEVVKYTTICNVTLGNFVMGMNNDTWNSLPDDIKKIFEENSGEKLARACGKSLDNGATADKVTMTKKGHTFIELDEAELSKWVTTLQPLHENWLKKMDARGIKDAREIHQYLTVKGAEYAKLVAEEAKK